jgi:hypothetical protein
LFPSFELANRRRREREREREKGGRRGEGTTKEKKYERTSRRKVMMIRSLRVDKGQGMTANMERPIGSIC